MGAALPNDGVSLWRDAVGKGCAPRKRLSVSQWADTYRVLSPKASSIPGPWRTDRVPYLREIMDQLSATSPVQRVVMMTSTQVAKTEAGLNWVGYAMHQMPSPMLVVTPTLQVRKRWTQQRLDPMLRESPALAKLYGAANTRNSGKTQEIKDFPGGGMLVLGGANSAASLASMPIRFALCDEVDRFKWELSGEGDPLGLIEQRLKAFPRRKLFLVSTPTVAGASRIQEEFEASDQRRYHMPCPHCSEPLIFTWEGLKWDRPKQRVWFVCPHNGCVIEEHSKRQMLASGFWRADRPGSAVRGYHLNALYAPPGLGLSWWEIVDDWYKCKDDPVKLKRFVNTQLGEVWEDRSRDLDAKRLSQRGEPFKLRQVPPGCLLLTAGIDTQDDRLELVLLGHGPGERVWLLDYVVFPGDIAGSEPWDALTEYLNKPLVNSHGCEMRIEAAAMDSGGHFTHDVYSYARSEPSPRFMAIKGSKTANKPILNPRPKHVDVSKNGRTLRKGVKLWEVGTDTAKHLIMNRLHHDGQLAESRRYFHFSEGLELNFYEQLIAEVFDPEKNRWVKRRSRRNEVLDCVVYGLAAAQHPELRAHALTPAEWARRARLLEPDNQSAGIAGKTAEKGEDSSWQM